ncbi:MAG: AEC family transporter [Peptococcaceae bacterium]|nr:AEC family transporter [Peptococcaceae bacterium]
MDWLIFKIIGIPTVILIGYIATKLGWIQPVSLKTLNKLLINIAQPSLIIYTMTHQTMGEGIGQLILWVIGLLAVFYAVSAFIGWLFARITHVPVEDRGIYEFSLTYTNNGFLGLPIALIVFGAASEWFFLMVMGNIFCVFLFFSTGILTITKNSSRKRTRKELFEPLLNMSIFSALIGLFLMLLHIQLPTPVNDTLSLLGNMMAPLAMLIVGVQLAQNPIRSIFSETRYYWVALMRLIAIPGALFLVLTNLPIPSPVVVILVLTAALPSPALSVIFAEEYGKNAKLAAEIVFVTTLLSIITLPFVLTILTPFFN